MCGIFGYKGNQRAEKILVNGLERLEYRGYDSAGIAVGNSQGQTKHIKSVGKVGNLTEKVFDEISDDENYSFGIAHTRWATHGGVTFENTHPHSSEDFFVVHNGIIENFEKLKGNLQKRGYEFYSDTDTEVIAKLLQDNKDKDLLKTVENILPYLEGAFALCVFSKEFPGEMIGVKYGSPLIFSYTKEGEFFFSSDLQALAGYTDNVVFLDDGDIVSVKNNDYLIKSEGKLVSKPTEKMDIESLKAEKGEYEHFMMKEIAEQPEVLKNVFRGRVDFENLSLMSAAFQDMDGYEFDNIVFVACGTSYNAGWLGSYIFEDITGMSAKAEIASEYEYKNIKPDENTLYVFISQSGETADSIDVLKQIKNKGGKTFGIVNVVGSTISRLTDFGLFTRAGTEVGVASTKAFISQVAVIYLLALYFGNKKGLNKAKFEKIIKELSHLPILMEKVLSSKKEIQNVAKELSQYKNFFFLGRHYQLPIAFESSLKFKEISYLHSEANTAGELKHGPLALIDENFPTVILNPNDLMFDKNSSSIQEIKARNGKILSISDSDDLSTTWQLSIPSTIDEIYPFLTVIVSQLLSYFVAYELEREIDKPRNLAKSVTVK